MASIVILGFTLTALMFSTSASLRNQIYPHVHQAVNRTFLILSPSAHVWHQIYPKVYEMVNQTLPGMYAPMSEFISNTSWSLNLNDAFHRLRKDNHTLSKWPHDFMPEVSIPTFIPQVWGRARELVNNTGWLNEIMPGSGMSSFQSKSAEGHTEASTAQRRELFVISVYVVCLFCACCMKWNHTRA
jgi:hypothetical protein